MAVGALALSNDFSLISLGSARPGGWQALLDPSRFAAHIACDGATRSARNLLGSRLDDAIAHAERPVLLLAEGAGCFAAAWWARLSPPAYVARVAGGLFLQPAEEDESLDSFASPRVALPFPSIVIGDVPGRRQPPRLRALAQGWGSRIVSHPVADADGLFRKARHAIGRVTAAVVAREVSAAERLMGQGG